MPDQLDLDAIMARLAAAAPGPWQSEGTGSHKDALLPVSPHGRTLVVEFPTLTDWAGQSEIRPYWLDHDDCGSEVDVFMKWRAADADLVAHAPEDLAALVNEVEQLRARIGELEAAASA